jgi:hypothetical protein
MGSRWRLLVVSGLVVTASVLGFTVSAAATPAPVAAKAPPGLPAVAVRPVPAGDEIVQGRGDADGWHLYATSAGGGWSWQPLATLAPAGLNPNGERWTGRQCLTADGRFVVAVIAPWGVNNLPEGMNRGGQAYAVDAHTGAVRPLLAGVSLHYFTPSCGLGSAVAFTRYLDRDLGTTQLVRVDAASGAVRAIRTVSGEVTNAVPAGDSGFLAVRGSAIVQIDGTEVVRARSDGVPYQLAVNAAGGVDFLVGKEYSATIWRLDGAGARPVGSGALGSLALFTGRNGTSVAAGVDQLDATAGIRSLPGGRERAVAASLDGAAAALAVAAAPGTARQLTSGSVPAAPLALRTRGSPVRSWSPDVTAPATAALPPPPAAALAGPNAFVSTCAVPRNRLELQAQQPSPAMVDWAANLIGRDQLTAQRPANFANLGLPAYAPSDDFPLPVPFGRRGSGKDVPREVLDAVWAQESNFKQASWHSIEGLTGNPLIADYYGAGGGYQQGAFTPDCGYGLGQVTTGMTTGAMDNRLQRKIAVDYAENAAASAQILASKWNELQQVGITPNDSDPATLENWYFAVWDYNSGLHANIGSGPWGLGWANNPNNQAYPFDRHPFLHEDGLPGDPPNITYDDASHPGDWPYQEKIFGWMEVPIIDARTGHFSYTGTVMYFDTTYNLNAGRLDWYVLARPSRDSLCDKVKNECDPGVGGDGNRCLRGDFECWWHFPLSWCSIFNVCHGGEWTVDTGTVEPQPSSDLFPPACGVNVAQVPAGATIVDSQPSGLNLEGCDPATANWHSSGTFGFILGDPAHPSSQQTDMDIHQLGTGLGGHIWFTHTNEPTDAAGVSYWAATGIWTPGVPAGDYEIKIYDPPAGAGATQANYVVDNGLGDQRTVVINQDAFSNTWVSLGRHFLGSGATVSLSNIGVTSSGDLAFSGVAFIPLGPGSGSGGYTIVGDSYSAGEGTGDYDQGSDTSTDKCHRSRHAFGRQFADEAGYAARHIACSGAKIPNLTTTGQSGEPAQLSQIPTNTNIITVTVGGNDAGFGSVLTRCLTPGLSCEDFYNQDDANNEDNVIDALRPGLITAYTQIRQRAPGARVVAVTYPSIFKPATTCPNIGGLGSNMSTTDVEWLIGVGHHLDDVIIDAARAAGIEVLDERYAFLDHELCTNRPWVYSLPIPWISGTQVTDAKAWFHRSWPRGTPTARCFGVRSTRWTAGARWI